MSECSCIKGVFDFTLEYIGTDKLIYEDMSDWMDEEGYSNPEEYTVNITLPGRNNSHPVTIKKGSKNIITSVDFNSGRNQKIQDGIYCFTVESCGKTYKRSKAVTGSLQCCLDTAYAQLEDFSETEELEEVQQYIKSIEVSSERGLTKQAVSLYKIANKLISKLNCNCNC